jgi:hypothetical protein
MFHWLCLGTRWTVRTVAYVVVIFSLYDIRGKGIDWSLLKRDAPSEQAFFGMRQNYNAVKLSLHLRKGLMKPHCGGGCLPFSRPYLSGSPSSTTLIPEIHSIVFEFQPQIAQSWFKILHLPTFQFRRFPSRQLKPAEPPAYFKPQLLQRASPSQHSPLFNISKHQLASWTWLVYI